MNNKSKIRYFIRLLLFTISLFFISSCTNKPEFEQYHKFDNHSWNRFKFVTFEYPVANPDQEYDIYIILRYLPEYPNNKFNFVFTIYKPSGEMRSSEHKIWIIGENGKLQGEEKGDYNEIKIPVSEGISFPETGTAKFEIENKMTKLETPGFFEVGLLLMKCKEEEK